MRGEKHLIFVAKIHEGTEGQAGRRGKFKRGRAHAIGQGPLDAGRLAGIARVFPVDVPARIELEVETHLVLSAGIELRLRKDQLHAEMCCIGGVGGMSRQSYGEQEKGDENGGKTVHGRGTRSSAPGTSLPESKLRETGEVIPKLLSVVAS